MLIETAPTDPGQGPRTLAIDIGGSHLKAGLVSSTGVLIGQPVRVDTPAPATPGAVLARLGEVLPALGKADRVSAGFPGVVRAGVVLTAPNLGTAAWHGVNLAERLTGLLGAPARVLNDATVQGLGVISGQGLECVITLGTGMGFALFDRGRPAPHLELGRHPAHGKHIYDDWIGDAARLRVGNKRWNRRLGKAIAALRGLTSFDTLLIGGGNAKYLQFDLPADVKVVANQAGITGGVRLWDEAMDAAFGDATRAAADDR
jgi:polyphosphate glucokinase